MRRIPDSENNTVCLLHLFKYVSEQIIAVYAVLFAAAGKTGGAGRNTVLCKLYDFRLDTGAGKCFCHALHKDMRISIFSCTAVYGKNVHADTSCAVLIVITMLPMHADSRGFLPRLRCLFQIFGKEVFDFIERNLFVVVVQVYVARAGDNHELLVCGVRAVLRHVLIRGLAEIA